MYKTTRNHLKGLINNINELTPRRQIDFYKKLLKGGAIVDVIDVRDLYFLTHLQGNAYLIYSLEWSQKIDKEDYIDWQYLLDNKLINKQEIETIKRFSSIESGILFGLCHQSAGSSSGEWLDEIKLSKACKSRALIMCQEIKKELHITQGEAKK